MSIICPNCGNPTNELVECEDCHKIGCPRCMVRKGEKWLCLECAKATKEEEPTINEGLFSMFG